MEILLDSLKSDWETVLGLAPRVAVAIVLLLVAVVLGRLLGRAVYRWSAGADLTELSRSILRRVVSWVVIIIGLTSALSVVGLGTTAAGVLAGGGATAVILGFAFRAIGENLLAGLFLAFQRPFEVDDFIQSAGYEGTVRAIDMRHTHIRATDGRDIFIPNARIFSEPLVNFTSDGLRRSTFTVGIDYTGDVARACDLVREAIVAVTGVLAEPAALVRVSGLEDTAVCLEVFYWVDLFDPATSLLAIQGRVRERARDALQKGGFVLGAEVPRRIQITSGTAPLPE